MRARRAAIGLAVIACASALAGCGLEPAGGYVPPASAGSIQRLDLPPGASLTVTSKSFTEQIVLGKMTVLALSAAGFEVHDLTNVPGSMPVRELMLRDGAQVTWDYTGTAWLTYLGHDRGIPDQTEQWRAVRDADLPHGLTWLPHAPLNNTYALAIGRGAPQVTSISEFAKLPVEQRTLCVDSEFNSRTDGLGPLLDTYGVPRGSATGVPEANIRIMDTGAIYAATERGDCTAGEVFTTDGRITALHLTVLADDKTFFPAYNIAPVVRSKTLAAFPGIADVLGAIAPKLTDDEMRNLNLQVDQYGADPAEVAKGWLISQGFLVDDQ